MSLVGDGVDLNSSEDTAERYPALLERRGVLKEKGTWKHSHTAAGETDRPVANSILTISHDGPHCHVHPRLIRSYTAMSSGRGSGGRSGGRGGGGRGGSGRSGGGSSGGRGRGASSSSSMPSSGVPYGFLPPFLPGSASLVEQLDRRLMVVLRDGRHLIGNLRSFDQFSNMVMEDVCERRILHTRGADGKLCSYYTDVRLGLYMVRGDSMVLLGEVDEEDSDDDDDDKKSSGEEGAAADDAAAGGRGDDDKPMKKVSLEEFERLSEEKKRKEEAGEDKIEALCWEFDLDLIV